MVADLPRFYLPDVQSGLLITLPEDEARHARVLRLKAGEKVHLANGKGKLFEASVSSAGKKMEFMVEAIVEEQQKHPHPFTLAVAPTKNTARFEWVLEKAVETGASRIIPIMCERSERIRLNHERLLRIASSAMKQSKSLWMPVIEEVTPFSPVLQETILHRWIAHCNEAMERKPLLDIGNTTGDRLVCIGPEGDFSAREINQATAAGFTGLTLGVNRLRTETAAIAVCIAANLLHG